MAEARAKRREAQRLIEEVIRRRAAGETITDAEVLAAHPELRRQLRSYLKQLVLVREAEQAALSGSKSRARTVPVVHTQRFPEVAGYEITDLLCRGGQGIVFDAVQQSTGQRVALKLLYRFARHDELNRLRHDREVAILAKLRDPRFVRLLDRGISEDRPYLVLEFADGDPIDVYVERHRPDPMTLLKLFASIADAVHVAHLHGVMHRDLKPQHILVDAQQSIRLLDFGLARILRRPQRDDLTMTGEFLGSMAWASPEQARGDRDLDLRSDVYSLGVVFYRLLTGRLPHELQTATYQTLQAIIDQPPRRPRELNRSISRDLETVLLTCLQKDRNRRYASAAALAEDLRNVAAQRPLQARRDQLFDVARSFARRHRALTATILMLIGTWVVASVGVTWLYVGAVEDRARAAASEERARRAAASAEEVNRFLRDIFASADPVYALARGTTVEEVLRRASDELRELPTTDPLVRADIVSTLADVYESLGWYEEAVPVRETAARLYMDEAQPRDKQLAALCAWAAALLQAGETDAAEEKALDVAGQMGGIEDARLTVELAVTLGKIAQLRGRFADAAPHFRSAQRMVFSAFAADPVRVCDVLTDVAKFEIARNQYADAEALLTGTLGALADRLPDDHPKIVQLESTLTFTLARLARFEEAELMARRVLAARQRLFGPAHPSSVEALNVLYVIMGLQGREHEMRSQRSVLVRLARQAWGADHPETAVILINVAWPCYLDGEYEKAEVLLRDALRIVEIHHPSHTRRIACLTRLALLAEARGDSAEAEDLHRRALAARRHVERAGATWGDAHQEAELGRFLAQQGRVAEALELMRSAVAQFELSTPEDYSPALLRAWWYGVVALEAAFDHLRQQDAVAEDLEELLGRFESVQARAPEPCPADIRAGMAQLR